MKSSQFWKSILTASVSAVALASTPSSLLADNIRITVESIAPINGTSTTPVWFGFHDGTVDIFNANSPASAGVEAAAEDGNFAPLRSEFSGANGAGMDVVLTGPANENGPPLFFPKTGNQTFINLDPSNPQHRYLNIFAMILPSNDAFVGNDNPMAFPVYDANGNFVGGIWDISGSMVYDAGTEVNDEVPANVPMLGQMTPNTGAAENGTIQIHSGFDANGNILAAFPNADFKTGDQHLLRIYVEKIPENHTTLEIEIQNLAPQMGTLLTPFWVGIHDGSFDMFNVGGQSSAALEKIAEDGNPAMMRSDFAFHVPFGWDTVVTGPQNPDGPPLFFQGQSRSYFANVDANNPSNKYLSFAAMILPSNDGFIGNDDPMGIPLFNNGKFYPVEMTITSEHAYDAGTEVNDEAAQNVPVLGQAAPNTGTTENGTVRKHPGFLAGGNVLASFPMADFTKEDYQIAKLTVWKRFNPWQGVPMNSEGLRDSPDFGIVDDSNFPWVNHRHHGQLYFPRGGSLEGFWVYNPQGDLGWLFTSESYYPRVYREADETWYLYQERTSNPRRFENLSTGEVLEIE